MGFRFRKSVRLAPGLRMNFSGSGVSLSAGVRGASMTFGRRGTYVNAGIPGTGFSARQRVGGGANSRRAQPTSVQAKAFVDDDGVLQLRDESGLPLTPKFEKLARAQQGGALRELLESKANEINQPLELVERVHIDTPSPSEAPRFEPRQFEQAEPIKPVERKPGILGALFKPWARRIERLNSEASDAYRLAHSTWESELKTFEESEAGRKKFIEHDIRTDVDAMEQFLIASLDEVAWPRETAIELEVRDGGRLALLDIDLPEIEQLPSRRASLPDGRWKLTLKDISERDMRKLYMSHVHAVGFRAVGETFAALQGATEVVASGYSQRLNTATGKVANDYLYSVRITRQAWSGIAFHQLALVDPAEALAQFEIRRDVTKGGIFKAIEPLSI